MWLSNCAYEYIRTPYSCSANLKHQSNPAYLFKMAATGGRLRTIVKQFECTLVEKKSRFVTRAAPVSTEAEARAFISRVSDHKASHNCWAYIVAPGVFRYSDDGEPGGTAGAPMYSAISSGGYVYTAVCVTRYFGGIKLGTGGLTRAYGRATSDCLAGAESVPYIPTVVATVTVKFDAISNTFRTVEHYKRLEAINSTDGCTLKVAVPVDSKEKFSREISDATKGTGVVEFEDA